MSEAPARTTALTDAELQAIDAWWRAANYLSVGQIYLLDNPLLREPLRPEHVKPRLLGHWGTTPGLNFLYVHINRAIRERDVDAIFITGPGHGGPAVVASTWLEGTYTEVYPHVTRDEEGMRALFRQFSFPGGIPSHVAPETPGSIHEGGELGYALTHAYGAAFDNPELVVVCVVGDGEAETGPLAASWHSNKFIDPVRDGAVLPILHLNGYKIANPTRAGPHPARGAGGPHGGLRAPADLRRGRRARRHAPPDGGGHRRGARRDRRHPAARARGGGARAPAVADDRPGHAQGLDRPGRGRPAASHQVPLAKMREQPDKLAELEAWMRSYRPEELFDDRGSPRDDVLAPPPEGERRMGANPHANGGLLLEDLRLPDFRDYAVDVPSPAASTSEATRVLGVFLRDVMTRQLAHLPRLRAGRDRLQPPRRMSSRSPAGRGWPIPCRPTTACAPDGRVMEVLSEHMCQGWLEGYLLTGRHGLFNCYEAFIHIVDSMFNQHAKWLKVTRDIPWRRPLASLNYLLTSHVWRQDHNGFSHQDPGFIDHVVNKKAEIVRVYLPPDANCLLSVADHCLRSRDYVNVIVAGKQPALDYLNMDDAIAHCTRGIGIWDWASSDAGDEPDVVMACAGDIPTLETLSAVALLRTHLPDLKVRVVNVVDLMRLQPRQRASARHAGRRLRRALHHRPAGDLRIPRLPVADPPPDVPPGQPLNLHVRGYIEEGTTTTPFDMVMLNDMDRFHLVMDVIDRVPGLGVRHAALRQHMVEERLRHRAYTREFGDDPADVRDWTWPG